MNNLNITVNSLEWRRSKVQELASQGYNQSEISRLLQISQPTINRDLAYLRRQAKSNIYTIDERLPESMSAPLLRARAVIYEYFLTAEIRERLDIKISDEVLVIGYPETFGFEHQTSNLPIVRQGMIASKENLQDKD